MSLLPTYAIPDNLPAPVTSGTTVQNFTDIWGDVWVAKNGVNGGNWRRARDVLYAKWYRNAAVNAGGIAAITLDTMTKDDYGLYAGSAFTAPVPGWYNVIFQLAVTSTATGQWCTARLNYTGGVVVGYMRQHCTTITVFTALCVLQTYLNAADTITTLSEASVTLAVATGVHETYATLEYRGTGQ